VDDSVLCFFQGRNINLQGYRTNPISHSLSVKKEIFQKNGSIGLGIDNFFTPAYKVHSQLDSPYLSQYTTNTLYNFMIKATFSYKIGKLTQDKNQRRGKTKRKLTDTPTEVRRLSLPGRHCERCEATPLI